MEGSERAGSGDGSVARRCPRSKVRGCAGWLGVSMSISCMCENMYFGVNIHMSKFEVEILASEILR